MAYDAVIDSGKLNRKLTDIATAIKEKGNLKYALNFYGGDFENAIYNFSIFKSPPVKSYADIASIPAIGVENEIAIISTIPATETYIDCKEPSLGINGGVWLETSLNSPIPIALDSKQNVFVYPNKVYQLVNGTWQAVQAKCFQNGQWKSWSVYLYQNGNECLDISGGWNAIGQGGSKKPNCLKLALQRRREGAFVTNNPIDLTQYNRIYANVIQGGSQKEYHLQIKDNSGSLVINLSLDKPGLKQADISHLKGNYKIALYGKGNSTSFVEVNEIFLE